MEVKGMIDKFGPPGGSYFIGKKCLKFLGLVQTAQNTVSIVPIIGKYKGLSEIQLSKTDRNVKHIEVF